MNSYLVIFQDSLGKRTLNLRIENMQLHNS